LHPRGQPPALTNEIDNRRRPRSAAKLPGRPEAKSELRGGLARRHEHARRACGPVIIRVHQICAASTRDRRARPPRAAAASASSTFTQKVVKRRHLSIVASASLLASGPGDQPCRCRPKQARGGLRQHGEHPAPRPWRRPRIVAGIRRGRAGRAARADGRRPAAGPFTKFEKRAVVLPTKPQAMRKISRVRIA